MIRGCERPYTIEKRQWCQEAEIGLKDTFYGLGAVTRENVETGRAELFLVNGNSWLVTQIMGGMLFIWCFQGFGVVQLIDKLIIVARENGLQQLSFFTRHAAILRALRRYNPYALLTPTEGEAQYIIEVNAGECIQQRS